MEYTYRVGDTFEVLESFSSFLFKGEIFSIIETDKTMNYYHQLLIGSNSHMSVNDDIISKWIEKGVVKMIPENKIYKVNKQFNIGFFFANKDDSLLLKVQKEKYYVFLHVSVNKTSFKEVTIKKDDFDMMLKINPSILTLEEKVAVKSDKYEAYDCGGYVEYYKNGKLHRDNDLPAIEYENGDKLWYIDGELHRENDKPAAVFKNGVCKWYKHGKLHRESGPAVVYSNGKVEYWIDGEECYIPITVMFVISSKEMI